jgi:hypothetical protein
MRCGFQLERGVSALSATGGAVDQVGLAERISAMTLRGLAAAGLAACMFAVFAPAFAQDPFKDDEPQGPAPEIRIENENGGQDQAPEKKPTQLRVTPQLIDAYIGASVAATRVRNYWKVKIDAATDDAEKKQMTDSAQKEVTEAVKNSPGITVREFAIILRAARENPKLADAIRQRFQALREKQKSP